MFVHVFALPTLPTLFAVAEDVQTQFVGIAEVGPDAGAVVWTGSVAA